MILKYNREGKGLGDYDQALIIYSLCYDHGLDQTAISVQRVFELLGEKGYTGGKTIVSIYLTGVRGSNAPKPVFCMEQSPGQRASHDWSDYTIFFTDTA